MANRLDFFGSFFIKEERTEKKVLFGGMLNNLNFIKIDAPLNTKNLIFAKIFAVGLILSALLFSPFVLDFTLTARFISISLSLTLLIYFLFKHNHKTNLQADPLLLFYFGWVLFSALSFFWAENKSEPVFEISKIILSFFVFLLTVFTLKLTREYFFDLLSKGSVIIFFAGLLAAGYQHSQLESFDKASLYSITGLNGHKNLYASFLFLNLFLLIKAFLKFKKAWKISAAISILLTLTLIFFLRTKAVWIGLIAASLIGLILYLYQKSRKRIKVNFYVALIACVIAANIFFLIFLQPIIKQGIEHNTIINSVKEIKAGTELDNERLLLWDKTFYVFKKRPLCGVGMGNWQIHFPDATLRGLWRAEDLNFTFQRPHNDFLWLLSETGLVGFNLFLFFLFGILLLLLKTLKTIPGNKKDAFDVIACVAFITGYFTISFFDFPKERMEHLIWINLLFGISYYYIKSYSSVKTFPVFSAGRPVYSLAFILLAFISVVGLLRYKGEYYTRKMYDAKKNNNNIAIIKAGSSAKSFAYSLDPTSLPVEWYTGNAHANSGNYKNAEADLTRAYQLNPYNRNVVNDLASAYAVNGKTDLAKKYYIESSRISPRFDDAKLNLIAIYINEKNFKAASACLDSIFHDSQRRSEYKRIVEAFE